MKKIIILIVAVSVLSCITFANAAETKTSYLEKEKLNVSNVMAELYVNAKLRADDVINDSEAGFSKDVAIMMAEDIKDLMMFYPEPNGCETNAMAALDSLSSSIKLAEFAIEQMAEFDVLSQEEEMNAWRYINLMIKVKNYIYAYA